MTSCVRHLTDTCLGPSPLNSWQNSDLFTCKTLGCSSSRTNFKNIQKYRTEFLFWGPFGNFGPRGLMENLRPLLYTNMTLTKTPIASKPPNLALLPGADKADNRFRMSTVL